MKKIISKSSTQTKNFARKLAKEFLKGGIIALYGELGSGKTTFAQGFAEGLKVQDKIISPTFLIIRQYQIPNQSNYFYHIDLYRLDNFDFQSSGLSEILDDPSNIVLIEWAEKISGKLPSSITKISLKKFSGYHELKIN